MPTPCRPISTLDTSGDIDGTDGGLHPPPPSPSPFTALPFVPDNGEPTAMTSAAAADDSAALTISHGLDRRFIFGAGILASGSGGLSSMSRIPGGVCPFSSMSSTCMYDGGCGGASPAGGSGVLCCGGR